MRNLSWEPKPNDWPADFDGTVCASAHGGVYRVEAMGNGNFRALFIRNDDRQVLPQTGRTRRSAAIAVYEHRRNTQMGGCACHLCEEHTSAQPSIEAAKMLIAESFNAYFANFDIRITPDEVVDGAHKTIGGSTWVITYRVDPDDAGMPCLEFYATSRMTNDRHLKISPGGEMESLDAVSEMLLLGPEGSDQDAAVAEFENRNETISQKLRERGLYPHGGS